jgi:hypothetical protein
MDDDRLVEKLEPFGEVARRVWLPNGTPWRKLSPGVQLKWSKIADAVLTEYDPEWPSRKAVLPNGR